MNIDGKTDKQLQRMVVLHWEQILKLSIADIKNQKEYPDCSNCAFCAKYGDCERCPVRLKTGRSECWATPFYAARNLYKSIHFREHRKIKTFHKSVQKMIDFLKTLEC